ncbi:Protein of unknown function [Blastococcus saxobsidens DD2]|uniref:Uncharacterized protein n=1 Tax=Blastococcus saxobsidens (strain DD2) TaxID=1146883 RepID=H6RIQ9_BLASD|nr:Protein of unknown function [Blastococcus saxobsidens DD2]
MAPVGAAGEVPVCRRPSPFHPPGSGPFPDLWMHLPPVDDATAGDGASAGSDAMIEPERP